MSEDISKPVKPAARPTRVRYVVLAFLAFMAASAYLTRHCLAASLTTIRDDIGFTEDDFGYLYSAFSLGYLLCQVPLGWLGQKYGTRATLPRIASAWSILTIITAAMSSLWAMWATRFGFGLAQAGMVPNQAKVVKDWFPTQMRGKVSSVLAMAMSLGGAFTVAITPVLLVYLDWRDLFRVYSLVGLFWALAFFWFFRTRPEEHPKVNQAELELIREGEEKEPKKEEEPSECQPKGSWLGAFKELSARALCWQLLFKAAGYNFFVTFFPAFLEEAYGIKKSEAGFLATLPLLGVVFGSLFGGAVIDWLYKRTGSKWISRCGTAAGTLTLTGLFILAATLTETAGQLAVLIGLGAFCSGVGMPCAWSAAIDTGGKNPAVVMGIMNSYGCLAGICISPFVGMLMKAIRETDGNWNHLIYLHAAFYIAAAIFWLLVKPDKVIEPTAREAKDDV